VGSFQPTGIRPSSSTGYVWPGILLPTEILSESWRSIENADTNTGAVHMTVNVLSICVGGLAGRGIVCCQRDALNKARPSRGIEGARIGS